jgi:pimeloyl-ACP methyl ester carboxylesterase
MKNPNEQVRVGHIELEVLRRGTGAPILLLHGFQNLRPDAPFLDALGVYGEVIAPSHPGFGNSQRPDDFETIYDLVVCYLTLLDHLGHDRLPVVGLSFGGWLAAEIALHAGNRVGKLVLVDPLGIKVSDRETADILDLFNTAPAEVMRRSWHDIRHAPDFDAMPDEEVTLYARNREALCRYAWNPYLHNPRLKSWLPHINNPTLVLWGASDGVVTPDYGRAFASLIPGARFELIDAAGHHPEIEQPQATASRIGAFLKG